MPIDNVFFGDPSYDSSGNLSIDPSFLDEDNLDIQKINNRINRLKAENDRRTSKFEDEIKKGPKERSDEYYKKQIKETFGFTPDTKGKKVAAGVLDAVVSMLPIVGPMMGFNRPKAQAQGRQDYEDITKAYKDLTSADISGTRLENQAYQSMIGAQGKKMSEDRLRLENDRKSFYDAIKARQADEKIFNQADQYDRSMDLKERLAMTQQAAQMAQIYLLDSKSALNKQTLEMKEAWDKAHPEMPFDVYSRLTTEKLAYMASDPMYRDKLNSWMDFMADFKNTSTKSPGYVNIPNKRTVTNEAGVTNEYVTPQFFQKPSGPQHQRKFGTDLPNNPATYFNEVLNRPSTPDAAQAMGLKPQPQAKVLTEQMKTNVSKTGNSVEDFKSNVNKMLTHNEDLSYGLDTGPSGAKNASITQRKELEDRKKWRSTITLLNNQADSAGNALASGDANKIRGVWNQSWAGKSLRTITGLPTYEIEQSTSGMFAIAEHLMQRFKSGRPAVALVEMLHKAIDSPMYTPEDFTKAQMMVSVLSQIALKDKVNPYFYKAMDDLDGIASNPETAGINFSKAMNEVVNEAVSNAKKNKKYTRVTVNQVMQRLYDNLEGKKNKTGNFKNDNNDLMKFL